MKCAKFSKDELREVLSRYSIGKLLSVKRLKAGSRFSPKTIITTESGTFVLKRRSSEKSDLANIETSHKVNKYLRSNDFAVPGIISPKSCDNSYLKYNDSVYELFEYVEGNRYDGSLAQVCEAASKLAQFHKLMADYHQDSLKPKNCFHDSLLVRNSLFQSSTAEDEDPQFRLLSRDLLIYYNDSAYKVTELGFDKWPKHIIHGDWHPGNILYKNHEVIAVLDFDSLKVACQISDLANATLQFSIIAGRPNPMDWPEYLDIEKMCGFIKAYKSINSLLPEQLKSLPDLMIETMIAEAIIPIAATGCFAHFSGIDFLEMIKRKSEWISKNRNKLIEMLLEEK